MSFVFFLLLTNVFSDQTDVTLNSMVNAGNTFPVCGPAHIWVTFYLSVTFNVCKHHTLEWMCDTCCIFVTHPLYNDQLNIFFKTHIEYWLQWVEYLYTSALEFRLFYFGGICWNSRVLKAFMHFKHFYLIAKV
jgi:hypothetical protein